ncbi:MAG: hypothetical protein RLN89_11165 [Parvibaculum sp.]
MNDQAQLAAVLLAGFFSTGDAVVQGDGLAGAAVSTPRARPEIVEISEGTCALVAAHHPAADVAFQPGVDVNGKAVVPANLEGGFQYNLRPIYEFDVRLKPLSGAALGDLTELNVATVTYEPESGRVLLDGQEVIWMHENALRSACKAQVTVDGVPVEGVTAEE